MSNVSIEIKPASVWLMLFMSCAVIAGQASYFEASLVFASTIIAGIQFTRITP